MAQSSNNSATVLALASLLGGCNLHSDWVDPNGYLDRRETISLHAGDAVATNKVTQMVDPWPAHSANNNIAFNGDGMQKAVERYRHNKVTLPVSMMTMKEYKWPTTDNSASDTANAKPPSGPAVNQVK
jgi:alkylated DNA repair dioxygenase AlkB